ncbi:hypothetical protein GCM10010983_03900 [Caulobacter rhizosphaerae]|nr:hypothetical protein GCM10010983_03900 [Caulobacter rhizosphaerae]
MTTISLTSAASWPLAGGGADDEVCAAAGTAIIAPTTIIDALDTSLRLTTIEPSIPWLCRLGAGLRGTDMLSRHFRQ